MSAPPRGPAADFSPAPGLGNPHVQTLAGKLLRPRPDIPLRRERILTPDGDFLDVDFAGPPDAGPTVVVLHGLEGSARRKYMMTTYRALLDRGLRPVGLNFRGCSGEPNRTARQYHSGETDDLRLLLERLRDRHDPPFGLVGFSLGGNVVLKLLGEGGADIGGLVGAAAAVSVPFDLAAGSRHIETGLVGRGLYTPYFVRSLRKKMLAKRHLAAEVCDMEAVRAARTLWEFDEAATAPVHGFRDAADYYARSSSAGFLDAIRVSTLVIHAMDDPFLPRDRVPVAALE
nr:alpha/beta fold hydrolase [Gemmatimonadota bacterium]NIQ53907.1 alpha/beta fold hydrolase [Gemmatimonadota bacterium]NIU74083.1 alpha/beta fold hydrolase [Gammaproteobacteria bacterium]NIX44145.1 alpha/beta fold hydrolase [Gemmatimonadota bacterium]NIY08369.1 alpha/beta fold hydrolase [Gemmatimonadota bacterium]